MSLHGAAVTALKAAADLATSSTDARQGEFVKHQTAERADHQYDDVQRFTQDRPTVAARGIIIGILMAIPFWVFVAVAAYLLI